MSSPPTLHERLAWPTDPVGLRDGPELSLVRFGAALPLRLSDPALARLAASVGGAPRVLLLGIGEGDLASVLLADRARALVVWDRDPWLLRRALERHVELRAALEAGRLIMLLGVDLYSAREELCALPRVVHPHFHEEFELERALLDEEPRGRAAALLSGSLLVADVGAALREQGFDVVPLEPERWAFEEIALAVERLAPEVVFCVNHRVGLAPFCAARGIPLCVWEIDPATDRALPREDNATTHVFTWRKRNVPTFREAGFVRVTHLALAANPARRRPVPLDPRHACDVAFVGSSMVESAQAHRERFLTLHRRWHPRGDDAHVQDSAAATLEGVLREQERAPWGTFALPELLAAAFGPFLDAWRSSALPDDPLALVAEIAAARARRRALESLAPFQPRIYGDAGFSGLRGWVGPAGHARELTAVYASAKINVDISRAYQPDIVTMRVFDVLACGSFVLAEHSPDLEDLFAVGDEIDCWRDLDELRAKIAHYLAHPAKREALAARGRAAVLERHTVAHRVRTMLAQARTSQESPAALPLAR